MSSKIRARIVLNKSSAGDVKMNTKKRKIVYITWFDFSTRSDGIAHHLGANSYHFRDLKRLKHVFALLKYILASFKTLIVLHKESPEVIFVENPPIFAVLVVWFYCMLCRTHYVVDTHSAAFTCRRWIFFLWLYRFLAKHALTNVLHNEPLAQIVTNWCAPAIVLEDAPQLYTDRKYPFGKGFNVVVVCIYSNDEPIYEVIKAARRLRNVNFYITGNLKNAPKEIKMIVPRNVILTDYLAQEDYVGLLKGCDIVVSLTTNDNTMQCGAHEGLELGRPIITSNWPVLKKYFLKGTIHIDNTASSLVTAIKNMRAEHSRYLNEIRILREERRIMLQKKLSKLFELLNCYK